MKHFLPSSVMLTPFLVKNYDAFVGDDTESETDEEVMTSNAANQEPIDKEKTES
ncbi:hypothetical protein KIV40_27165 [Vibrio sp. D173a]|uniref:hypothetical protein n=1 Tax=unclassified Vibrio TaxID=2614977 RepID=UPI00255473DA|nr:MULTISPECIES: hypothetical protein [unclassified Vibrio]MDK9737375.1 hypothetical protein [Vibrio sp. D404a]MDK9758941.1 hypothetical protein [Vibrio sp. D173a]MDK9797949.1 hypothetical protein [Vibrio sp. D449a]